MLSAAGHPTGTGVATLTPSNNNNNNDSSNNTTSHCGDKMNLD